MPTPGTHQHEPWTAGSQLEVPHANIPGQVLLGGYLTPLPPSKSSEKHSTPSLLRTIKETENGPSGDDENPKVTHKA